jgi:hypothetical protein
MIVAQLTSPPFSEEGRFGVHHEEIMTDQHGALGLQGAQVPAQKIQVFEALNTGYNNREQYTHD